MQRWRTIRFPCILALVVTLLLATVSTEVQAAGAPFSPMTGCSGWKPVKSPSPAPYSGLYGVVAISTNDAWAVGYKGVSYGIPRYTLIEHWNGTQWSVVSSPSPGKQYNWLLGVVVTTNGIWAVGYEDGYTLIERWNGTSWNVVSSPNIGTYKNVLEGVVAVAANDIWAVGYYSNDGMTSGTLIEHWNGTNWSIVSSPSPGPYNNILSGVSATSASDIWAVGSFSVFNGSYFLYTTLTMHWNGSTWTVVKSANREGIWNVLNAVTTGSGTKQVWAVGYSGDGGHLLLTERWNGTKWSSVPSVMHEKLINVFYGVTAIGPNSVFAVGLDYTQHIETALIEQWNGSEWLVSYNSAPGQLFAVTAVPDSSHLWAVGTAYINRSPVILSYC